MVKLPFEFLPQSIIELDVRAALDELRIDDAKRIAAEHLRAGYHSQPFLEVVAEILEIKKETGVVGRKQLKSPKYWLEIGNDYQDLRDAGLNYEEACAELATRYGKGFSESTIKNTVAWFENAHKIE
jgi:hypothetical protein